MLVQIAFFFSFFVVVVCPLRPDSEGARLAAHVSMGPSSFQQAGFRSLLRIFVRALPIAPSFTSAPSQLFLQTVDLAPDLPRLEDCVLISLSPYSTSTPYSYLERPPHRANLFLSSFLFLTCACLIRTDLVPSRNLSRASTSSPVASFDSRFYPLSIPSLFSPPPRAIPRPVSHSALFSLPFICRLPCFP